MGQPQIQPRLCDPMFMCDGIPRHRLLHEPSTWRVLGGLRMLQAKPSSHVHQGDFRGEIRAYRLIL